MRSSMMSTRIVYVNRKAVCQDDRRDSAKHCLNPLAMNNNGVVACARMSLSEIVVVKKWWGCLCGNSCEVLSPSPPPPSTLSHQCIIRWLQHSAMCNIYIYTKNVLKNCILTKLYFP